ncbi:MAG TPA: hypothetical protein V6D07_16080 [Trichocoleus sp.]
MPWQPLGVRLVTSSNAIAHTLSTRAVRNVYNPMDVDYREWEKTV